MQRSDPTSQCWKSSGKLWEVQRRATEGILWTTSSIDRVCTPATHHWLLPSRFYDDSARAARVRMWQSLLADDRVCERVRIATTSADEVVGFGIRGPARDDDCEGPELYALYILEEHYGTGLGQRLLDAMVGREAACLWVAAENPRAIRFYERNGFQLDGTRKSDPDIDGLDEIRMARR